MWFRQHFHVWVLKIKHEAALGISISVFQFDDLMRDKAMASVFKRRPWFIKTSDSLPLPPSLTSKCWGFLFLMKEPTTYSDRWQVVGWNANCYASAASLAIPLSEISVLTWNKLTQTSLVVVDKHMPR